jgi:COP9 signalosome complex subunit 3
MCYVAVKNLERGLYFFEAALTTQSMAVSQIMIEAYKKFVLVSLILHGKIGTLPKYTSSVVNRFIRRCCEPYNDLAIACATNSPDEVRIIAQKQVFQSDKNEGLVKQVVQSVHKKNIQRLTKTFLTLSMTDVASRVFIADSAEAEDRIVNMVGLPLFFSYFFHFQKNFRIVKITDIIIWSFRH